MDKVRPQIILLITFVIFLLTHKNSVYRLWVMLVSGSGEYPVRLQLEKETYFNDSNIYEDKKAEITLLSQTVSGSGLFGRDALLTDSTFAKIKRLIIELNISFKLFGDSAITWFAYMANLLSDKKSALAHNIMRHMSHSHQILVTDMVFGQVFKLDDDFYHKLKITGMLHVVAASGFNISLMTIISNLFSRHYDRFKSFLIWIVVVGGYLLMTDLSISILRAFLMMLIKKIGNDLGMRNYHNLYSLATACLVLLLFNFQIIEKVSFQLSVMATLGIIIFMPLIGIDSPAVESTSTSSIGLLLKESLSTTIAAQLLTTPIILYHFSELSLISLLSNVLLLWLTPIITYGGILIYIFAFISTFIPIGPIMTFISLYLWMMAEIFIKSVGLLSNLNFLFFQEIKFTKVHLILYSVMMIILYLQLVRKNEKNKKAATSLYSLKFDLGFSDNS